MFYCEALVTGLFSNILAFRTREIKLFIITSKQEGCGSANN